VPQNLTVKVPAGVSERAAATVTVGAIALQGVRMADPQLGNTVAVIGLGLLGQITTMLLVANGCRVIGVDLAPDRVALASAHGAYMVLSDAQAEPILAGTGGRGVDTVIITAASRENGPIELAAAICRDRGRVVVVGDVRTDLPRQPFYHKELELRFARSYGPGRYDASYEEQGHDYPYGYVRWTEQRNMEAYLHLVGAGKIDTEALITHTFPIEDAVKAYEIVSGKRPEPHLGILLTYPEEAVPVRRITLRAAGRVPRERVRIGVIGAGEFATGVLFPRLAKLAELHAICSQHGLSARAAARRFGFAHIVSGPQDVIHDPDTDLVFVLTPHEQHAELVIQSLNAKKAVFVEKPLAVTREELGKVSAAHAMNPQPLMVGFNRRFAPLTRRLRDFLGPRTEPLVIHYRVLAGTLPAQSPWHNADAGGRIVGEVCHFIDYCRFLVGSRITRVFAESLPTLAEQPHPPDNVQVLLKFADGSVSTVSYVARAHAGPGKEEISVMGAGRTAVLSNFQLLECYGPGKRSTFRSSSDKGHTDELKAVVEGVQRGEGMPIPFEESCEVTRCTFAVGESLALGEPVMIEVDTISSL
jgi:polar amino acid transport system substrate-binding protein